MKKIIILCLVWVLAVLIATPSLASTEYAIPNSTVSIGVSDNTGINISYSASNPSIGVRVYHDAFNATWCIPPDKSADGQLDIIVVPVTHQNMLFGWLPWI